MTTRRYGRPWLAAITILLMLSACSPIKPRPTPTNVPTTPAPTHIPTPTPACDQDGHLEIDNSVQIPDSGLPMRFQVYLPPCYETHTWATYPLLILVHGNGGGEATWNGAGAADEVNRLIQAGEVPPFVLVTPYNDTEDREGELIVTALLPYLEANYRLRADRQHRAAAGGSRGGALSARMGFRFAKVFSSIGVFGAGAHPVDEERIRGWIEETPPELWPRVFIDVGDQDILMVRDARFLASIYDDLGVPYTLHIGEGNHSYGYWLQNFEMYLKWVAEEW